MTFSALRRLCARYSGFFLLYISASLRERLAVFPDPIHHEEYEGLDRDFLFRFVSCWLLRGEPFRSFNFFDRTLPFRIAERARHILGRVVGFLIIHYFWALPRISEHSRDRPIPT